MCSQSKRFISGTLLGCIYIAGVVGILASGSGDGDSDNDRDFYTVTIREDNLNIPAEHQGLSQNNTRFYAKTIEGHNVSVVTSGLEGKVSLDLNGEILDITTNSTSTFFSTFEAGEIVTIDILAQPVLQSCNFVGSNSGVISSSSPVLLQLSCIDTNNPAKPVISMAYSGTINTINLEWDAPPDRDTIASEIGYRIYWSVNRANVENKSSSSVPIPPGTLSAQLTGLTADTEYYIGIEAIDIDGNVSALSQVATISTIAAPSVLTGTPYHVIDSSNISVSGTTWTIGSNLFSSPPSIGDIIVSESLDSLDTAKVLAITLVSGNYEITVTEAGFSDLFQSLALSSEVSLSPSSSLPVASPKSKAVQRPIAMRPTICRNEETTLTTEQTDQIAITLERDFLPRINLDQLRIDLSKIQPVTG